jgi:hypothetical protein
VVVEGGHYHLLSIPPLEGSDEYAERAGLEDAGNELMESAAERDRMGHEFGALCVWTFFNSEAAIVLRTDTQVSTRRQIAHHHLLPSPVRSVA